MKVGYYAVVLQHRNTKIKIRVHMTKKNYGSSSLRSGPSHVQVQEIGKSSVYSLNKHNNDGLLQTHTAYMLVWFGSN